MFVKILYYVPKPYRRNFLNGANCIKIASVVSDISTHRDVAGVFGFIPCSDMQIQCKHMFIIIYKILTGRYSSFRLRKSNLALYQSIIYQLELFYFNNTYYFRNVWVYWIQEQESLYLMQLVRFLRKFCLNQKARKKSWMTPY